MAAGLGFKTFTTGEVLTAADTNGYLMQGILVFASEAARNSAITSPQEGQFAFTKDNNSLWYYDGAAWVSSGATGDIEGVTAGVGISGGGTSGTVTVTNSMATAIDAKGDLVPGTGADTFARLAVGANDTVLTADSTTATGLKWAAPASSAGMSLIGTYTMPGTATTYSLNSVFTSTYTNYMLVGKIVGASTGNISIKLRASGSDTSGSDYDTGIAYFGVTQSDGKSVYNATSNGFYIDNVGNDNSCSIEFQRPQEAVKTFFIQTGMNYFTSVNGYWRVGGGIHQLATSYDGFTITGGSNLSGTFSLYGLAK